MDARNKTLKDGQGVIRKADGILPETFKAKFLKVLSELEDNEAHKHAKYPVSELHKIVGCGDSVYRAYIDKLSGWRLHVQFDSSDSSIRLCDVLTGAEHDRTAKVIKTRKQRYK